MGARQEKEWNVSPRPPNVGCITLQFFFRSMTMTMQAMTCCPYWSDEKKHVCTKCVPWISSRSRSHENGQENLPCTHLVNIFMREHEIFMKFHIPLQPCMFKKPCTVYLPLLTKKAQQEGASFGIAIKKVPIQTSKHYILKKGQEEPRWYERTKKVRL